jgi:predicted phosphodiesterase
LAILAILAMKFGALGDIHGDFEAARRVMARHPEIPFWLCVGDVADSEGRYEALPHPRKGSAKATGLADKRRHFVREEVEACRQLAGVDVLLTHEAPRPYFAGTGPRRNDAGKTPVNEILSAMRPRLHLFGHHHRFTEQERQGVRSIGLDLVGQSYLLIDARTLEYDRQQ